jgi:hypothetical protein
VLEAEEELILKEGRRVERKDRKEEAGGGTFAPFRKRAFNFFQGYLKN